MTGKVQDPTGDRLTPIHTRKGGRRIRYYISNRLLSSKDPSGWRLPAEHLEASVAAGVADHLDHTARSHDLLNTPDLEANRTLLLALAKAHAWTAALKSGSPIAEIARREDVSQAFIRTRAKLACLSPRELCREMGDGV